jgi:hypothetical protein
MVYLTQDVNEYTVYSHKIPSFSSYSFPFLLLERNLGVSQPCIRSFDRSYAQVCRRNQNTVACRGVAMQRPRDKRIYQGRFWTTALYTSSRNNRHEGNNRRAVFSMWPVPRCYKQGTRLELRQYCEGVGEERTWAGGRGLAIVGAVTRKRLVEHYRLCALVKCKCDNSDSVIVIRSYDL